MSMDANYALSEEEIEQGYVLTCQAHPATERVVVSYDEP
jgi:ring-1,2-phenylacetyl-CoA epoxidase subunit PaaE